MLYGNIIIEKRWKIEKGDKSWNNNYNYYSINISLGKDNLFSKELFRIYQLFYFSLR